MMPSETVVNPEVAVERVWHYVQNGQSLGPIPESELVKMLVEGRLGADTLVWTESLTDWTPASRIEAFHNQLAALPLVVVPPSTTLRQRAEAARAQGVRQVRPWPRCLARWFDFCVAAFLLGVVAGCAGIMRDVPEYAWGLAVPFAWVFLEGVLLSAWGTTPGKWLFSVWVADAMGNRLSFSHALSRAFSVWFMGLGLGLPIVQLITQIVSYVKLKNQGITSWDREGRFAVIHEPLSPVRVTIASVVLVAAFCAGIGARVLAALQQAHGG
jgi:uncharacterized RDD family membrane protein YckC